MVCMSFACREGFKIIKDQYSSNIEHFKFEIHPNMSPNRRLRIYVRKEAPKSPTPATLSAGEKQFCCDSSPQIHEFPSSTPPQHPQTHKLGSGHSNPLVAPKLTPTTRRSRRQGLRPRATWRVVDLVCLSGTTSGSSQSIWFVWF